MLNFGRNLNGKGKLRLQKSVILVMIGAIAWGIFVDYANFYKQVVRYSQSLAYREVQEASKEYKIQVMRRNQKLFSSDESERSIRRD